MSDQQPNITYNKQPVSADHYVKLRAMDLEAGQLWKFFGGKAYAPANISGLLAVLLVLAGLVLTFWKGGSESIEYWKLIAPIVTLVLGYIFGKK